MRLPSAFPLCESALHRPWPVPFSFYPSLGADDQNRWWCRRSTWSELVAVNSSTGEEVCIPRRFVGGVSVGESVVVSLLHEVEMRGGKLRSRGALIEFPGAGSEREDAHRTSEARATVVSVRPEWAGNRNLWQLFGVAVLLGTIFASFLTSVISAMHARDRRETARSTMSREKMLRENSRAASLRHVPLF